MSENTNIYKLVDDMRKEIKSDMQTMKSELLNNQNRLEGKLDNAIISQVQKLDDNLTLLDKNFSNYKTENRARLKIVAAVWGVIGSIVTSVITAYIITRYVS